MATEHRLETLEEIVKCHDACMNLLASIAEQQVELLEQMDARLHEICRGRFFACTMIAMTTLDRLDRDLVLDIRAAYRLGITIDEVAETVGLSSPELRRCFGP